VAAEFARRNTTFIVVELAKVLLKMVMTLPVLPKSVAADPEVIAKGRAILTV